MRHAPLRVPNTSAGGRHAVRSSAAMLAGLALAGLGLFGCNDKPTDPVVCTAIAIDALVVTAVDATTGRRICDARVVAVDGSFSERLRSFGSPPECTYSGPTERAGLYEVRATRVGYEPAATTSVRVTRDECHVIPVRVVVEMQRVTATD